MPKQDLASEVRRDQAQGEALREWIRLRVANIHSAVTAHDVLRRFGVELEHVGSDRESQISCPFHGQDRKQSARVYPADDKGRTGVWCYVCREQWTAIDLWKRWNQFPEDTPFTRVLRSIEKAYGLPLPPMPDGVNPVSSEDSESKARRERVLQLCENRLSTHKTLFKPRDYLTLCSLMDRLWHAHESGKEVEPMARQVLDKIGGKVRCAP